MYIYNKVYVALAAMVAFCLQATAQQKIENPKIDYSGAPKEVRLRLGFLQTLGFELLNLALHGVLLLLGVPFYRL